MNFRLTIPFFLLVYVLFSVNTIVFADGPSPEKQVESPENVVTFSNELIDGRISPAGIVSWKLKEYKEELFDSIARDSSDKNSSKVFTGLFYDSALPGEKKNFVPSDGDIHYSESEKAYVATFGSTNGKYLPKGLELVLRWSFSAKYSGRLNIELKNNSDKPLDIADIEGNELLLYCYPLFSNETYRTYAYSVNKSGESESISPAADTLGQIKTEGGYIGITNQYYALGIRETTNNGQYIHTKRSIVVTDKEKIDQSVTTSVIGWKFLWDKIRSNETLEASFDFYIGPKQEMLLKEANYKELFDTWSGITGPIGRIMFSLLTLLYSVTGHYGYAIILLTLIVKIILHPLSRKQMISMKKMQLIQPEMQRIKEKIKDPQQQQLAMQKLFIENEVNPIGGCLPLLFQLPIFIALYTCLSSAIELKNVSFLWLPDLAQHDPTFALPLLFSIGNYYTMQANSAGTEQMPMMKFMPVMMFFFFSKLASGVLIYFVGQSLFSFVEQKYNKTLMDDPLTVEAKPVDSANSAEASIEENTCKKSKKKKKKS